MSIQDKIAALPPKVDFDPSTNVELTAWQRIRANRAEAERDLALEALMYTQQRILFYADAPPWAISLVLEIRAVLAALTPAGDSDDRR